MPPLPQWKTQNKTSQIPRIPSHYSVIFWLCSVHLLLSLPPGSPISPPISKVTSWMEVRIKRFSKLRDSIISNGPTTWAGFSSLQEEEVRVIRMFSIPDPSFTVNLYTCEMDMRAEVDGKGPMTSASCTSIKMWAQVWILVYVKSVFQNPSFSFSVLSLCMLCILAWWFSSRCCFEIGFLYPRLVSNSLCSGAWPQTCHLNAFTSQMLGLQAWTTMPCFSRSLHHSELRPVTEFYHTCENH